MNTTVFRLFFFHGLYNLASMIVLGLISAPSHSLLNVGKRISNVLVASIVFKEKNEQKGIIGLVVASLGGIAYILDPKTLVFALKRKGSAQFYLLVRCTLIALFVFTITTFASRAQNVWYQNELVVSHETGAQARERRVILLGPHDRYNFGDLLFSKVLERLLIDRAGYRQHNILLGGVVSTNMSSYGGGDHIYSMKQLQRMSREDREKGPYDIIYTGGEALGCTHDCALGMMPNEELKEQARKEKISDCGYLVPKSYLVPDSEKDYPSNFAVINSMGGTVCPQCEEAVRTADFGSFRDPKFPSYPDSAVMTKHLYQKEIDFFSKEVLNNIFPQHSGQNFEKKIRCGATQGKFNEQGHTCTKIGCCIKRNKHNHCFFCRWNCPWS